MLATVLLGLLLSCEFPVPFPEFRQFRVMAREKPEQVLPHVGRGDGREAGPSPSWQIPAAPSRAGNGHGNVNRPRAVWNVGLCWGVCSWTQAWLTPARASAKAQCLSSEPLLNQGGPNKASCTSQAAKPLRGAEGIQGTHRNVKDPSSIFNES